MSIPYFVVSLHLFYSRQKARRVKGEIYKLILQRKVERIDVEFPYIRSLLQFDSREFLNVLDIAFDEADDSGTTVPAGEGLALPSRQVVVDTLLFVMVKDRRSLAFSPDQVCHLFTFIARQLARHGSSLAVCCLTWASGSW